MTAEELDEWGAAFLQFCTRFANVFRRKEPSAQAAECLRGLMASVPRKNGWPVAEVIGDRLSHSRRQATAWRLCLKQNAGMPAQLRM
jgi:hypothetical protein